MRRTLILLLASLLTVFPASAGGGGEDAAAAKKGSERKLTSRPSWIDVDPVAVAILRRTRIDGMFLVEFGLDVTDEGLRHAVTEQLPRLRDVWVRALADFSATRVRIGKQADLTALTERLQGTTDRVLGQSGAQVLLLQAIVREK